MILKVTNEIIYSLNQKEYNVVKIDHNWHRNQAINTIIFTDGTNRIRINATVDLISIYSPDYSKTGHVNFVSRRNRTLERWMYDIEWIISTTLSDISQMNKHGKIYDNTGEMPNALFA
jgi:hypothetical protein